jgi:hypothetical protein
LAVPIEHGVYRLGQLNRVGPIDAARIDPDVSKTILESLLKTAPKLRSLGFWQLELLGPLVEGSGKFLETKLLAVIPPGV